MQKETIQILNKCVQDWQKENMHHKKSLIIKNAVFSLFKQGLEFDATSYLIGKFTRKTSQKRLEKELLNYLNNQ